MVGATGAAVQGARTALKGRLVWLAREGPQRGTGTEFAGITPRPSGCTGPGTILLVACLPPSAVRALDRERGGVPKDQGCLAYDPCL
ncbi:hypothetical protein NDU88_005798 [Pleurodeles waltl]|uniref:Uncharacterized protein n=1 Tax=Pleurodeles waltl TaxID=8319 RepID=A0AAV7VK43_PLEWA|nr:hypothetical protein NDU88_005798 [Pleurodeles waltl]